MQTMTEDTCETCYYHRQGTCRRDPPRIGETSFGGSSSGNFPRVKLTDWCGHWSSKKMFDEIRKSQRELLGS